MNLKGKKVVVCGAGGFIGNHLAKYLVDRGYWVRGVDVKLPEYGSSPAHEFDLLDLRKEENCLKGKGSLGSAQAPGTGRNGAKRPGFVPGWAWRPER